uniref:SH3 domain-containing protein n=1 Tax=Lotharella globosa TaxID=91324 RepID=A0A7S3Z7A3_9EUKA
MESKSSSMGLHYSHLAHQFPLLLEQVSNGLESMEQLKTFLSKLCEIRANVELEVFKLTKSNRENQPLDSMNGIRKAIEDVRAVIEGNSKIRLQEFRQVEELVISPMIGFLQGADKRVKTIKKSYYKAVLRVKERKEDVRKHLVVCLKGWQSLHGDKAGAKQQQKVYKLFQKHEKLVSEVNREYREHCNTELRTLCEALEKVEIERAKTLKESLWAFKTSFFSSLQFMQVLREEFKIDTIDSVSSIFSSMMGKWVGVYGEAGEPETMPTGLPCDSFELVEGNRSWESKGKFHRNFGLRREDRSPEPESAKSTIETVDEVKEFISKIRGGFTEMGEALWDYNSGNEKDLSFKVGNKVAILEKDDSGWWTGEFNGTVGFFPGNYVKIIPKPPPIPGHKSPPAKINRRARGMLIPEKVGTRSRSAPAKRNRRQNSRHSRSKFDNMTLLRSFCRNQILVTLNKVTNMPGSSNDCTPSVSMCLLSSDGKPGDTVRWPRRYRTTKPIWNTPRVVGYPSGTRELNETHLTISLHDDKENVGRASIALKGVKLGQVGTCVVDLHKPQRFQCEVEYSIDKFYPKPKYVFLIRHGESEWNLAQEKKQVMNMMKKVDHGLSNDGRLQAERLSEKLKAALDVPPGEGSEYLERFMEADAVYSSPLTRALQTAVIALQHHPKLRDPRSTLKVLSSARERRNFGGRDTQGKRKGDEIVRRLYMKLCKLYEMYGGTPKTVEEVKVDYNDATDEWWDKSRESDEEFDARLDHLMAHLQYTNEENIIVVTHSFLIRGLFQRYLGKHFKKEHPHIAKHFTTEKLENCAVVGLQIDYDENHGRPSIVDFALLFGSQIEYH